MSQKLQNQQEKSNKRFGKLLQDVFYGWDIDIPEKYQDKPVVYKSIELRDRLAKKMGLEKSYNDQTLKDWFKGNSLPYDKAIEGLVEILSPPEEIKNEMLSYKRAIRKTLPKHMTISGAKTLRGMITGIREEGGFGKTSKFGIKVAEEEGLSPEWIKIQEKGVRRRNTTNAPIDKRVRPYLAKLVRKWESGEIVPNPKTLHAIANLGKLEGDVRTDFFDLAADATVKFWEEKKISRNSSSIPGTAEFFELKGKRLDNFFKKAAEVQGRIRGAARGRIIAKELADKFAEINPVVSSHVAKLAFETGQESTISVG